MIRSLTSTWAHFFILALWFLSARATKDVELDDTDPAITYSLTGYGNWYNQSCSSCSAKPNPELCHGGTWHEFSNLPSERFSPIYFTVDFYGPGISVYAIFWDPPTTNVSDSVDYNFTYQMDEGQIKSFSRLHLPLAHDHFTYDQNVVKYTRLADKRHILTVTLQPLSFFMLDYVVITKQRNDVQLSPADLLNLSIATMFLILVLTVVIFGCILYFMPSWWDEGSWKAAWATLGVLVVTLIIVNVYGS